MSLTILNNITLLSFGVKIHPFYYLVVLKIHKLTHTKSRLKEYYNEINEKVTYPTFFLHVFTLPLSISLSLSLDIIVFPILVIVFCQYL